MSRPLRLSLAFVGLLVFVAISAGLARTLSGNSAERAAVEDVAKAEARGDAPAVVRALDGCSASPACRARIAAIVARVRRAGEFKVLRYDATSTFVIGEHTGVARIAWRAGTELPVIQCVRLRRRGGPLTGTSVSLLRLSGPLDPEAGC